MPLTVKDAEKIRESFNENVYDFSIRIGYSYNAYRFAKERNKLSERMAREIWRRYNHLLKES
jgi:hypothetical protein